MLNVNTSLLGIWLLLIVPCSRIKCTAKHMQTAFVHLLFAVTLGSNRVGMSSEGGFGENDH